MTETQLPREFLSHACAVLGEAHDGLTGAEIARSMAAYAAEYGISIPFPTYPNDASSKHEALYDNLCAFTAAQQHRILGDLCQHQRFTKPAGERNRIEEYLSSTYGQFSGNATPPPGPVEPIAPPPPAVVKLKLRRRFGLWNLVPKLAIGIGICMTAYFKLTAIFAPTPSIPPLVPRIIASCAPALTTGSFSERMPREKYTIRMTEEGNLSIIITYPYDDDGAKCESLGYRIIGMRANAGTVSATRGANKIDVSERDLPCYHTRTKEDPPESDVRCTDYTVPLGGATTNFQYISVNISLNNVLIQRTTTKATIAFGISDHDILQDESRPMSTVDFQIPNKYSIDSASVHQLYFDLTNSINRVFFELQKLEQTILFTVTDLEKSERRDSNILIWGALLGTGLALLAEAMSAAGEQLLGAAKEGERTE